MTSGWSSPPRPLTVSWSLAGSAFVTVVRAASPLTRAAAPDAPTAGLSTPLVALTITRSASPSPPPPMADRSSVNSVTSVPLRSLTVVVSAPASERTMTASTSLRSIVMAAMSRVSRTRPPFADTAICSPIAEPLKRSVSRLSWPSSVSLPSPGSHCIVSLPVPARTVSAPWLPSRVSLPLPPRRMSAPLPPLTVSAPEPASTVSWVSGARLPVAPSVSAPAASVTWVATNEVSGQVATPPETEHPPAPSPSTSELAPASVKTMSVPEATIAVWFVSPSPAVYSMVVPSVPTVAALATAGRDANAAKVTPIQSAVLRSPFLCVICAHPPWGS